MDIFAIYKQNAEAWNSKVTIFSGIRKSQEFRHAKVKLIKNKNYRFPNPQTFCSTQTKTPKKNVRDKALKQKQGAHNVRRKDTNKGTKPESF